MHQWHLLTHHQKVSIYGSTSPVTSLTRVRSYHIGLQIDRLQSPLPCYHRVNIHNPYDEHTQLIIIIPKSKYVRKKTEKTFKTIILECPPQHQSNEDSPHRVNFVMCIQVMYILCAHYACGTGNSARTCVVGLCTLQKHVRVYFYCHVEWATVAKVYEQAVFKILSLITYSNANF